MKNTLLFSPSKPAPGAELRCFHCQEPCPPEHPVFSAKDFCCEGCMLVYQILEENNLCQYYNLDENPGQTQKNRRGGQAYAWLDDEDVQRRLVHFSDGQTTHVDFYLPSMHCASCIWLLEHLYRLDPGVRQSKVDFLKKTVSIRFDEGQTSLRMLATLLSNIGYPPEINLGDVDDKPKSAIDRTLYYQLGLAGFAFGNIMLLSFPEYLGLEKEREAWFFGIFGYLNLALALPVLLYSARGYLTSAWTGLRHSHLNLDVPLAAGILMLFGRSAYEILSGTGAGYMDSFAGLIFFLLTGKWFQQKTYHHLSFERDYKSYFPVAATVRRPGYTEEEAVPVQKLFPGDIIVVRHGELIPADGVLLRGHAQIDYSFVTGEADPVGVEPGARIFAGGKQTGEALDIRLIRKVSTSYLTQLWNDQAFAEGAKSHATLLADRAGRYFTGLILLVAGGAFLFWAPRNMGVAVNAATAVLMVACPCAVALSIPFTMGQVLRLLGRNRFYVKSTEVLEGFSEVKAVVLDKTGTITNIARNAVQFKPLENNTNLSRAEQIAVRSLAGQSNHPLSRQIAAHLADAPDDPVYHFAEHTGQGVSGQVLGLDVRIGSASFAGPGEKAENQGVYVRVNGVVRGYFEIQSRFRRGLPGLLAFFRKRKLSVTVLSGDNSREAAALAPYFPNRYEMLFHQSPHDKSDFVKDLQSQGKPVLMLGDGLNDAGALRQSRVGIVVAENTNNFTPACDAILHAGAFDKLPKFLELSAWGMRTVNRAYLLAACYNIVGLSYAVSGTLRPVVAAILMPLSSVTIVLFGFLMTNWKAWRLGILQPDPLTDN